MKKPHPKAPISSITPNLVKKTKETRKAERQRLQGSVSNLRQSRDGLGKKVLQQIVELTVKDQQLKQVAVKQQRSTEQVHIRTKAMEAVSDGIFIIDAQKAEFPVIYANPAFQTMTGYSRREILGHNYFLLYGKDADPRLIDEIKHTIDQGKSFHSEMLNFQKNGEKYWNLLRISPVRDAGGIVTHYVGIQTDITLMRQRDLEIKEQREELLHVTRVGKLSEFVSSLAHEISQPLTAILAYSQAALRILKDRDPELTEIFQYIVKDDQRAAEVVRRLRSLLKKTKPEIKLLNINEVITETVDFITTDVMVRNNVLKTDLAKDLPPIYGDKVQLQQVILNLMSNSFEAMEHSQSPRDIEIKTSLRDVNTVEIAVKDTGCGIPVTDLPKLFEHFFTSKADGLGMGLSISRSIVEAHGGQLNGENNPDRGVTFTFTLPTIQKEEE